MDNKEQNSAFPFLSRLFGFGSSNIFIVFAFLTTMLGAIKIGITYDNTGIFDWWVLTITIVIDIVFIKLFAIEKRLNNK